MIAPGDIFKIEYYSGPHRQHPNEYGFRVRVVPCGTYSPDTLPFLDWPLIALLTEDPYLADAVLVHDMSLNVISDLLAYLTMARAPYKVFVCRATTRLLLRLGSILYESDPQTPLGLRNKRRAQLVAESLHADSFHDLISVVNEIWRSNNAYGWGYSPLFCILDLLRVAMNVVPAVLPLSAPIALPRPPPPIDPWGTKELFDHQHEWYFLEMLRTEVLCKSIIRGEPLPSRAVLKRAFSDMSDKEILRWLLRQPEICLRIQAQKEGWEEERKEWLQRITEFDDITDVGEILVILKNSILPEAFTEDWFTSGLSESWERDVLEADTESELAVYYIALESHMKWDDCDEKDRVFDSTWASRRDDWLSAMNGIAEGKEVKLPMVDEILSFKWTYSMDQELVSYVDWLTHSTSRRVTSLSLRDINPFSLGALLEEKFPLLCGIPLGQIRSRFAVLKMLGFMLQMCIPVVDLTLNEPWSISPTIVEGAKHLMFHGLKVHTWTKLFARLYSDMQPQFVILNRKEASRPRSDSKARFKHSLFFQLFQSLRIIDPQSLRRRGQAWRVKFVGESGHDVGGMYNESLLAVSNELQSDDDITPLFIRCPNYRNVIGDNREKWVPRPSATSSDLLEMYTFIGRLMGIACLDSNRAFSIDLPSYIWKNLAGETLDLSDLKAFDFACGSMLEALSRCHSDPRITSDSFPFYFPDLWFTSLNSEGVQVELVPDGCNIQVTYHNCDEYVRLVQSYRLRECREQVAAIARGLNEIVPIHILSIFTWRQVEILVTGSPEINVDLLRSKTIYRGGVTAKDKHIRMFWRVLHSFSLEDRKQFLQFVWGRNRLPSNAIGFGRDLFKISDHPHALQTGLHDQYLPMAHTCFFAFELPRYSDEELMREKILYAIHNCVTNDLDATLEGRANAQMRSVMNDSDSDEDM